MNPQDTAISPTESVIVKENNEASLTCTSTAKPPPTIMWYANDEQLLSGEEYEITGGILVLGADIIGRTVLAPTQLAAGLVTSLIGAPLFAYLLIKKPS